MKIMPPKAFFESRTVKYAKQLSLLSKIIALIGVAGEASIVLPVPETVRPYLNGLVAALLVAGCVFQIKGADEIQAERKSKGDLYGVSESSIANSITDAYYWVMAKKDEVDIVKEKLKDTKVVLDILPAVLKR